MLFFNATAQDQSVTGKITDESGRPLQGVSITTAQGKTGTTTDAEGNYKITVPPSVKALIFTDLNYETATKTVTKSGDISFAIISSDKSLTEVVITAYGIKRDKKTLGYSTPIISSEDLTAVRNTNITNAVVGKVAGVRTQGTGGSFAGSAILIRGYTSMTGSSAPLFVIDGVPIDNGGGGVALQNGVTNSNRAVDINPDDVQEMTILKGAAATSLYGSRDAAGVILITTKKGTRKSKNNIDVNSSYSVVSVNRLPEYQNGYAQGTSTGASTATATVGLYNFNASTSWGPRITGQNVTNFFGKH